MKLRRRKARDGKRYKRRKQKNRIGSDGETTYIERDEKIRNPVGRKVSKKELMESEIEAEKEKAREGQGEGIEVKERA